MPFVSERDVFASHLIKLFHMLSISKTFGKLGFKVSGFTNGIYSLSESQIFLSIYFLSNLIMRHSSLGLCTELLCNRHLILSLN